MIRVCGVCGKSFEGKRPNATFCGAACRQRNARALADRVPVVAGPVAGPVVDDALVAAAKVELLGVGKLDSLLGQQAVVLAACMAASESASAITLLSRELRAVMDAALGVKAVGVVDAPPVVDDVDDLRLRRDSKRMGG